MRTTGVNVCRKNDTHIHTSLLSAMNPKSGRDLFPMTKSESVLMNLLLMSFVLIKVVACERCPLW